MPSPAVSQHMDGVYFVLSYSGLPVFVPNFASVGDMCAIREDYRLGAGSVLGLVEGIVGE